MKKNVKMLTNIAGQPPYYSGDVVELEDEIADAWIKEGYAKLHREEKPSETAKR